MYRHSFSKKSYSHVDYESINKNEFWIAEDKKGEFNYDEL